MGLTTGRPAATVPKEGYFSAPLALSSRQAGQSSPPPLAQQLQGTLLSGQLHPPVFVLFVYSLTLEALAGLARSNIQQSKISNLAQKQYESIALDRMYLHTVILTVLLVRNLNIC